VTVKGTFHLTIASDHVEIGVNGSMNLDPIGSLTVSGAASVGANGFVASLTATLDASFGAKVGLKFTASVSVQINTSSNTQPLAIDKTTTINVPAGFRVHIQGSVTFQITVDNKTVDLASATGMVDVAIQDRSFTLQFDVTIHLAGLLDIKAKGGAGVYADANPGIALLLDVSVDANIL